MTVYVGPETFTESLFKLSGLETEGRGGRGEGVHVHAMIVMWLVPSVYP